MMGQRDEVQEQRMNSLFGSPIIATGIVDFHHSLGPIVECVYPNFGASEENGKTEISCSKESSDPQSPEYYVNCNLPDSWKNLAFFCLPDGAHANTEDSVYFHMSIPKSVTVLKQTCVFGISCVRQIARKDIINPGPHVTRAYVQKAVFVICQKPLFGFIHKKLSVVTDSYFAARDLSRFEIVKDLYDSLNDFLGKGNPSMSILRLNDQIFTGTCLREMVVKMRQTLLVTFKLLMLEKKVIIYTSCTKKLAQIFISLFSLFPAYSQRLDEIQCRVDSATCAIREFSMENSKVTGSPFGFPLGLFLNGKSIIQPYLPLNEVDFILNKSIKSFVVGTSNLIISKLDNIDYDVFIDLDEMKVLCQDETLAAGLALSNGDRLFVQYLINSVESVSFTAKQMTEVDTLDPFFTDSDITYNDEWIRTQFKLYLSTFLTTYQYEVQREWSSSSPLGTGSNASSPTESLLYDYNLNWVTIWKESTHFPHWSLMAKDNLHDICQPGHPFGGKMTFQDLASNVFESITPWMKSGAETLKGFLLKPSIPSNPDNGTTSAPASAVIPQSSEENGISKRVVGGGYFSSWLNSTFKKSDPK